MDAAWWRLSFTIDRVVPLAMMLMLILSWIGARAYVSWHGPLPNSPFVTVWAHYEQYGDDSLLLPALAALLVSVLIPLPGTKSVSGFARGLRASTTTMSWLWIALATCGPLALAIVKGPYLLYAPEYLAFALPQSVVSVANLFAPVALVAAGAATTRRPWLGGACGAALIIMLFASGTRLLAAAPLLIALGRLLAGGKKSLTTLVLGIVAVPFLLPLPLVFRNLGSHGLIPYAAAAPSVVQSGSYLRSVGEAVAENVSFSIPLLSYTADIRYIGRDEVLASISPLSAESSGWDRIQEAMRVHDFIPFSMLGEFASLGRWALFTSVVVWALCVRVCVISVLQWSGRLSLLAGVIQSGLGLLSVVYALQYNTRSVSRILSVMIATSIVFAVLGWLLRRNPAAWFVPDPIGSDSIHTEPPSIR